MILDEIGAHVSPAQAIAAMWLFAGFFAGKAIRVGAELVWCSFTGRQLRPCGCRHCVSVRLAANRPRPQHNHGAANVIPFPAAARERAA
jgi:hypothetical protein